MQSYQERVIIEKKELDEKLARLYSFCYRDNAMFLSLPIEDRDLLEDQYSLMEKYSYILGRRIERFEEI